MNQAKFENQKNAYPLRKEWMKIYSLENSGAVRKKFWAPSIREGPTLFTKNIEKSPSKPCVVWFIRSPMANLNHSNSSFLLGSPANQDSYYWDLSTGSSRFHRKWCYPVISAYSAQCYEAGTIYPALCFTIKNPLVLLCQCYVYS